ncbi:MAG: precorrin-6y C5,15-methyltransferase (decarboxylating) subunit CbiE [Pseudomonadota bacterium]
MSKAPSAAPWLTLVGLGENGPDGLSPASRQAIDSAEIVMGPPRHLSFLPDIAAEPVAWPVPFVDGLAMLKRFRGRRVVVLASGDPFWFGAGAAIARTLDAPDWHALPGPSTFSLAASRLGWSLERTLCLGLHAAPLARLRPHLAPGVRAIVLLRDGPAVAELAAFLDAAGFGDSALTVMEALGGPREKLTPCKPASVPQGAAHPVAVAIAVSGDGAAMPRASGIPDAFFETDGQLTKRPIRALALSALAPKPFETLWDIGGGSGSIAVEWLLAHPTTEAVSVERRPDRAAMIRANADRLGVDRLQVVEGAAPDALDGLTPPQAVFIGGGLSDALLEDLTARLPSGTRLVAHAVTLGSEARLSDWSERYGGTLLRIDLSEAAPLGPRRGWKAAWPVVQWQVVL